MARGQIKFTPSKDTIKILDEAEKHLLLSVVSPFTTKTQFFDYCFRMGLNEFVKENKEE